MQRGRARLQRVTRSLCPALLHLASGPGVTVSCHGCRSEGLACFGSQRRTPLALCVWEAAAALTFLRRRDSNSLRRASARQTHCIERASAACGVRGVARNGLFCWGLLRFRAQSALCETKDTLIVHETHRGGPHSHTSSQARLVSHGASEAIVGKISLLFQSFTSRSKQAYFSVLQGTKTC